jgi:hypothetical protein
VCCKFGIAYIVIPKENTWLKPVRKTARNTEKWIMYMNLEVTGDARSAGTRQ